MDFLDWLHLAILLALVALAMRPVGSLIEKALDPKAKTFLDPVFKPMERGIYRFCRIDPMAEQDWKSYLANLLGFSFISFLFTFVLLALQYYLFLNPQKFDAPSWHLNLNTSISFMTNTNWQNYSGESAMSYFSQMAALAVQNFLSPAVGLCSAAVLVRGLVRKSGKMLGNFWADLVRIVLYVLIPISFVAAVLLLSQGVPQNFSDYVTATTLEGQPQSIALGPIASQEAIKMVGTNGGGYMGVNSAHPYENPTPFSNFIEMFLMFLLPASCIYYFGKAIKNTKHAWFICIALAVFLVIGIWIVAHCEAGGNPAFQELGIVGGNMEGKEQRFGTFGSSFFACMTTAIACGAVNCAHDSLIPMGGFIPMLNMQLGETIFGGVGAGLYTVLLYILLSIFISGLIIGRTPEYLGKKIEAFDVKMTILALLSYVLIVHVLTSWACFSDWGLKGLSNNGPHGFSEMLYAYSSCAANNGSAFAGLSGNTIPYNLTMALAMLLGRFAVIVPVIALGGSLVVKKYHPPNASSFPISSPVFITLLIGVILLVGALTFLPALTMGPILEQFFLLKGTLVP